MAVMPKIPKMVPLVLRGNSMMDLIGHAPFNDNLKNGPELTLIMALLITRAYALRFIADCSFPSKNQVDINVIEHILASLEMEAPKFIQRRSIGVKKPLFGKGMLVVRDNIPIVRTDTWIFRIGKGWILDKIRYINNILAAVESPILFSNTSHHNAPDRKEGKRFVFTIRWYWYMISKDMEVAIHLISRNHWWLKI
eukprot:Phypoly_transcript_03392.p1 GENE.Phypoly_transcript_03392~~Phypoly_transcript_03392.p1  ORF type:complete len:196 (+),score=23.03 Phypoly_transcript_03392:1084-1671(+)